jgi:hypothetical protein
MKQISQARSHHCHRPPSILHPKFVPEQRCSAPPIFIATNQQRKTGAAHRNIIIPKTFLYRTTHPLDITNSAFASTIWKKNITVRCTLCLSYLAFLQISRCAAPHSFPIKIRCSKNEATQPTPAPPLPQTTINITS